MTDPTPDRSRDDEEFEAIIARWDAQAPSDAGSARRREPWSKPANTAEDSDGAGEARDSERGGSHRPRRGPRPHDFGDEQRRQSAQRHPAASAWRGQEIDPDEDEGHFEPPTPPLPERGSMRWRVMVLYAVAAGLLLCSLLFDSVMSPLLGLGALGCTVAGLAMMMLGGGPSDPGPRGDGAQV